MKKISCVLSNQEKHHLHKLHAQKQYLNKLYGDLYKRCDCINNLGDKRSKKAIPVILFAAEDGLFRA